MRLRSLKRAITTIVSENKLASILFIIAAFLRLYRFPEFMTFLGDQGRDAIIIKRILTLEHLPAIGAPTSIGQIFLGPFYYYLMSPFLLLANFNPAGLGIGVTILSLIGIVASYFIAKKNLSTQTAIFFLIFTTFSISHIELSRFSWNPNLLPIFSFLTLFFFYQSFVVKKRHLIWAILLGSFLSFDLQLHYLAALLFVPMLLFLFQKIRTKKTGFFHIKKLVTAFGFFILFSLPLIIFDLRHQFLNSKNLLAMFTRGEVSSSSSYTNRLNDTALGLFNTIFKLQPTASIAILFFLAIGVLYFWARRKIKNTQFSDLVFANSYLFLFVFSLLSSPRYPHYYGSILFSLFLIFAVIVKSFWTSSLGKVTIVVLICVYVALNAKHYFFLYNSPSNQLQEAKKIAAIVEENITHTSYQVVSLPFTQTSAHIRYFLELNKKTPLPEDYSGQPEQLFVLCFERTCQILGNPQWQIASFADAKIDKIIPLRDSLTIYRLSHGK